MAESNPENSKPAGKYQNIIAAVGGFLLFMFLINWALYIVLKDNTRFDLFQNLAVSIIISWIGLVIVYYVWAIKFYNINMGWTDSDWEAFEKRKLETPGLIEKEPEKNPDSEESMGLPKGTIRATIALSLLVAALAVTIASLSTQETHKPDLIFVDRFEFFKTAFLMMIAFYFGSKSLDFLKERQSEKTDVTGKGTDQGSTSGKIE